MILTIQFLRFFAASLVVMTHAMAQFPEMRSFGAFGVDIFFVISGFIISFITHKDQSHFFLKRLIRIVPQYWAFTLGLALITLVAPSILRSATWNVEHILASLFFVPWWTEKTGFSPLLRLGWTLNYEMFFYLVFWGSMKISVARRELLCSVALLVICLAINAAGIDQKSPLYFYADSIIFEFIFGMLLAVLYRERRSLFDRLDWKLLTPLAGGSLSIFFLTDYQDPDALPRALIWGIPAFFLVYFCMRAESYAQRLNTTTQRWVLTLGEISYPLYLIHVYCIVAFDRVLTGLNLNWIQLFVLSLAFSSLFSLVAIRLIDQPARKIFNGFLKRRTNAKSAALSESTER